MFRKFQCSIPQDVERQLDKSSTQFIETVLEEERRVRALRAQELQLTAENPRIREYNETSDISAELRATKHDEILHRKRRQQLRENNLDLRQLQVQLRAAYASMQLAEQKNLLDRKKEEERRSRLQQNDPADACKAMEALREEELKEWRKKDELRAMLQKQMEDRRTRRQLECEEIMRDRDSMQEQLRRLTVENATEMEKLKQRKKQTLEDMKDFMRSQELFKLEQRAQIKDENKEFLERQQQCDEQTRRLAEEKRRLLEKRQACSEQIGQQLHQIENEKRNRENLLLDLLVEERKAKEDFRYRQKLEKQMEERLNLRLELERYRDTIGHDDKDRKKEEEELLQREAERMAEHKKQQQEKEELHRQKTLEHGRAIQEMIEVKRKERINEATEKMREYEYYLNEERKIQQEVQDERIRMLREQPADVLRYLPVGVIRVSDREHLSLPPNKEK